MGELRRGCGPEFPAAGGQRACGWKLPESLSERARRLASVPCRPTWGLLASRRQVAELTGPVGPLTPALPSRSREQDPASLQLHGGWPGAQRPHASESHLLPRGRGQQHPAELQGGRPHHPAGARGPRWLALRGEREDENVSVHRPGPPRQPSGSPGLSDCAEPAPPPPRPCSLQTPWALSRLLSRHKPSVRNSLWQRRDRVSVTLPALASPSPSLPTCPTGPEPRTRTPWPVGRPRCRQLCSFPVGRQLQSLRCPQVRSAQPWCRGSRSHAIAFRVGLHLTRRCRARARVSRSLHLGLPCSGRFLLTTVVWMWLLVAWETPRPPGQSQPDVSSPPRAAPPPWEGAARSGEAAREPRSRARCLSPSRCLRGCWYPAQRGHLCPRGLRPALPGIPSLPSRGSSGWPAQARSPARDPGVLDPRSQSHPPLAASPGALSPGLVFQAGLVSVLLHPGSGQRRQRQVAHEVSVPAPAAGPSLRRGSSAGGPRSLPAGLSV